MDRPPLELLARFRHSLRLVDRAIERGSRAAGLTVQQQAFLLALKARGGAKVPLADVRTDLGMDMATTSELLQRLVRARLVRRRPASDRRYLSLALTAAGEARFARSMESIAEEIHRYDRGGEFDALVENGRRYFAYYRRARRPRKAAVSAGTHSRRTGR